jgi:hypothetical protein
MKKKKTEDRMEFRILVFPILSSDFCLLTSVF